MSILSILIVLIIIGVALYLVQLIPMNATFKKVIMIIAIAAVVIYALKVLLPIAGLH